jgi:hypothetical protein
MNEQKTEPGEKPDHSLATGNPFIGPLLIAFLLLGYYLLSR